jgi:GTPase SAR1 family protein
MTQVEALKIMKMGHSVFLTGGAGSGKTYVLNQFIQYLREHDIPVAITASTGIAATHIGGMTIHAWSGIGIRDYVSEYDLDIMETKKYLWDRFQQARVLIIDEVSMMSAGFFESIDRICKHMKRNPEPFGGLQVILCGDLFQLPPIEKGNAHDNIMIPQTSSWQNMRPVICYLHEQHRQSDDTFTSFLNAVRTSNVTDSHIDMILDQVNMDEEINFNHITQLFTHNADVDRINSDVFMSLDEKRHTYEMTSTGKASTVETLKRGCMAPEVLDIKIGTQVMFVKNNFEAGYVNGTRGQVIGYSKLNNMPIVKTIDGNEITVEPSVWAVATDDGKVIASITQIPLRHAWAITVHKSQGMSLDQAFIDLSKAFTYGMGYVALSRLRTLSGLTLAPITADGIRRALVVDPKIMIIDRDLQNRSAAAVERLEKISEEDFKNKFIDMIKKHGGSIETVVIKNNSDVKTKISNQQKTHHVTYDMLSTGENVYDIAKKRELTTGTIIEHIIKCADEGRDVPKLSELLEQVDPRITKTVLKKIQKTLKELGYEKLSPVKSDLEKQGIDVSFDVLKLVRGLR